MGVYGGPAPPGFGITRRVSCLCAPTSGTNIVRSGRNIRIIHHSIMCPVAEEQHNPDEEVDDGPADPIWTLLDAVETLEANIARVKQYASQYPVFITIGDVKTFRVESEAEAEKLLADLKEKARTHTPGEELWP